MFFSRCGCSYTGREQVRKPRTDHVHTSFASSFFREAHLLTIVQGTRALILKIRKRVTHMELLQCQAPGSAKLYPGH